MTTFCRAFAPAIRPLRKIVGEGATAGECLYDPKRKYPVLDFTYASPVRAIVPYGFDAAATNFTGPSANAAAAEMGLSSS